MMSAFTPVSPKNYQQIDSLYMTPNTLIRKSPVSSELTLLTGRRYRQSELANQISSIQREVLDISQNLDQDTSGSQTYEQSVNRLCYLQAILKQKQKHLLRLQKNVVVQKSIRSKKRNLLLKEN
ncbi:hypothetical protein EIN_389940 [Entamoeba invadens IP1]|uniref:Uncharacterized protein n=1 Tax=Entamoeba invadens IP1 TaxID=370355 RepID=A0A0A1U544_ENTIV|nr:hypothetical protein EIN_389940 [Entamoeba invadens IP1]ELP89409.1 hypothetical protein EIN_389940 [Entamoeba invadens IP1]|eukprot:XP_004256180.1 hypothetical protein EIN_389940 [Entamoeba invadens IP1]